MTPLSLIVMIPDSSGAHNKGYVKFVPENARERSNYEGVGVKQRIKSGLTLVYQDKEKRFMGCGY